MRIRGRPLVEGEAEGTLLVSREPISFYGGVDPESGVVVEKGHELEGESVAGRILVFPHGKGSTVGSYILLRLAKRGLAPAGIVNLASEPIIIIGCLISGIPLMDGVDPSRLESGWRAEMHVGEQDAFLDVKV